MSTTLIFYQMFYSVLRDISVYNVEMLFVQSYILSFYFIHQVAILSWVRFQGFARGAAIASTVIIVPAICVFIAFGIMFYRRIISHKCEQSTRNIDELEQIARDLGQANGGSYIRGGVHIA